jgi:hypothetical protein
MRRSALQSEMIPSLPPLSPSVLSLPPSSRSSQETDLVSTSLIQIIGATTLGAEDEAMLGGVLAASLFNEASLVPLSHSVVPLLLLLLLQLQVFL